MLPPEMDIDDPFIYRVPTANPIKLVQLFATSIPHWIRRFNRLRPDYSFPISLIHDLTEVGLSFSNMVILIVLAFTLTLMRYWVQRKCKGLITRLNIYPRYQHKFPETVWKMLFYSFAWLLSLYAHTVIGISSFTDPISMWEGWSSGNAAEIPKVVFIIYTLQAGFYLHSIYATLFMDLWRKDSWLMFVHHFIALALLAISYTDGFLLPGALLVFLHDNSDAMLEIAKLAYYLKKRKNGEVHAGWEAFGNITFIIFVGLWVVFRLYWYPCKLLYGTLYGAVYLGPQDAPLFPILGIMLLLIFLMNVYWFNFIARMLIRVALTGEEPEDNREWDTSVVSGLDKKKLDELAAKKSS